MYKIVCTKLENEQEIKFCAIYKHLGVEITNERTLDTAIKEQNLLGKKAITVLKGILWDRNILGWGKRNVVFVIEI